MAEGQQRLLKLAEEAAGALVLFYPLHAVQDCQTVDLSEDTACYTAMSASDGLCPRNEQSRSVCRAKLGPRHPSVLIWNGCSSRPLQLICLINDISFVLATDSKPKVKALTLSQIEARVEDPTIALKQLLKEHK